MKLPFPVRLKIWMYDVKLMAGWWWLASPLTAAAGVFLFIAVFPFPDQRAPVHAAPIFESLLPLLGAWSAAPLFNPEQSGKVGELRLALPESRGGFVLRRLVIGGVVYAAVWLLAFALVHRFFVELDLAVAVKASVPGSSALAGLAVFAATVGGSLAAYAAPAAYWAAHYALFPGIGGFTLFPWQLSSRLPADLAAATLLSPAAPQWIHGVMGLLLLVGAIAAAERRWMGGGLYGDDG